MSHVTVGVPKEIKEREGRVALTPKGAAALIKLGADVIVEKGAGALAGFSDRMYRKAGAILAMDPIPLWVMSDLVLKVKEPQLSEYRYLQYPQLLFTYLHPAGNKELVCALLHSSKAAIAYEDVVEMVNGQPTYPLLAPMSRVAGEQSALAALGWHAQHGRGDPTALQALVIAGGIAGVAALEMFLAKKVGANFLFEKNEDRAAELDAKYGREGVVVLSPATPQTFLSALAVSDMVVCAPMLPCGQKAPIVLKKEHFLIMKRGTYLVDISIDQDGSTEYTRGRPTRPGEVFEVDGVTCSAAQNIPGSTVPKKATRALTQATFPYVEYLVREMIADPEHGLEHALRNSSALRAGLQAWNGKLLNESVAKDFGLESYYEPVEKIFG